MAPTYIVYNRRQQGLAETTRLILEISGADYQNKFVQDWDTEKASTPLGLLPVLIVDKGDGTTFQISESSTIERFLSHRCGLLGTSESDAAHIDMLHANWTDMTSMFLWRVWRVQEEEKKKEGVADFWKAAAPFLEKHDKLLGQDGYYHGGKISLVDVFAYTWLNRWITGWIPTPPNAITQEKYPNLWKLWENVKNHPKVKDYVESGRWKLEA